MIGNGFEKVGSGSMSIQELITGVTPRKTTASPAFIQVWNGASLDTYNYTTYFDTTLKQQVPAWIKAGASKPAELEVPVGFTCWFQDPIADVTISVAGQVISASSHPITLEADEWKMVANPYPIATALNGGLIDWSNFTARKTTASPDFIQFWNGEALDTYNYTTYFDTTLKQQVPAWIKAGTSKPTELEIPVATGFWINSPTGGDIIFKQFAN